MSRFKTAAIVGAVIGAVLPVAGVLHEQRLHPQVILQDDGVTPPNSCLPTACLETLKHPHSHVMLVRYVSGEGHAYCLWTEHRRLFASDWRGTAELFPETGGVMGIARALPVPYDGLVVESAFIMPTHKQGENND